MDRRTRRIFALVLVLVIAITGGAALILGGGGRGSPDAPPDLPTATGVIVAVDSAGLSAVHSFTLRQSDGTSRRFELAKLENGVQFPPGHLNEHLATARPIKVWYRDEAGILYAIRLEDAP